MGVMQPMEIPQSAKVHFRNSMRNLFFGPPSGFIGPSAPSAPSAWSPDGGHYIPPGRPVASKKIGLVANRASYG
jgi:hypothetical protein